MKKSDIKIGTLVAVDEKADGKKKSMGTVVGIYKNFFVIEKDNGLRSSILWSDCKNHVNLVIQKKERVYDDEFENIIAELTDVP